MAFKFHKERHGSHAGGFFAVKEALKAAGWSIRASSDGLTFSMVGDLITHTGAGAGGINTRAWFVARQPGQVAGRTRELCWQHAAPQASDRIKWAVETAFTGGAPSALVVPTATDQQLIAGGGTDAAPTFTGVLGSATAGARVWAAFADDAAPYGFAVHGWSVPSRVSAGAFVCDPLVAGGSVPGDLDPYALVWGFNVVGNGFGHIHGPAPVWTSLTSSPADIINPNPDGRYYLRSPLWYSAASGVKGYSTLRRLAGNGLLTSETLSVVSTRDTIVLNNGSLALPWDGTFPEVV